MITYIKIDGFKSFQNFEMEFTPLTVIAGTNAAGKSNLFDALKLLSSLAETDKIQKSFLGQRGDLLELFTYFDDKTIADTMSFTVEMLVNPTVTDPWGATGTLKYTRLRYELTLHRFTNNIQMEDVEVVHERLETIKHDSDKWIKLLPKETAHLWRPKVTTGKRQQPYMKTEEDEGVKKVIVSQDGAGGNQRKYPLNHATRTVLSSFDSVDFKHILAAKEEMKSWRFMELNPEDLRMPTKKASGGDTITATGKNLASALFRIKQDDPYNLKVIARKLHSFIPMFNSVDVFDDTENKQYVITLKDVDGNEYTSRVLSEGTMRILSLCILLQDTHHKGLLCFEEPENGIHPFRIKAMVELLKDLSKDFRDTDGDIRQVIINTHSTLVVQEMNKWMSNPNLTIAFAQMVNSVTTVGGERKKLMVTKITPVEKNPSYQTALSFTVQEKKMTMQMVREFLNYNENESNR